jgi:GT2 family glycosyltransferase
MPRWAVVAVGRNESKRLARCLEAARRDDGLLVYVDSGSTDGSPSIARALGVSVVELDPKLPFTAARARNEGLEWALAQCPDLAFVQFVDADCELAAGWLERAMSELQAEATLGAVGGRLREAAPEASVYNLLVDLEWDTPVGDTGACLGTVMMRVEAFREAGGFDPQLIAGEEPDLCIRLRRQGWKIRRLADEMSTHDARMTRLWQWWLRMVRAGHAYAEGRSRYGDAPERHWRKECRSIWCWTALATAALALAWPSGGWSLLLLAAFPLQILRIARRRKQSGTPARAALLYGVSCMLGKFPQAMGQMRFHWRRARGGTPALIEYQSQRKVSP